MTRGGGGGAAGGNTTNTNLGKCDYISVTQINLRHTGRAWSTLLTNIFGRNNPIILATEPYTQKNHKLPRVHKDLVSFYYKKGDIRPRAAILVHKNLADRCWELPQFTTHDQVAIRIKHDHKELVMVSTYMDGNKPVPPKELTLIVDYAKRHRLPLVIGSDTNSHHVQWGNKGSNSRGENLLDFLDSHELQWTNKGSSPTFLNSRGQNSIIDLTITNEDGKNLVQNWHVSSKHSDSDHRYIFYDIASQTKTQPKQIRLARNTDWNIFNENLANNQILEELNREEIQDGQDLDKATENLNQILVQAFEAACPITYISSAIKKPPWLTPEIQEAQREIKHKLMRARSEKTIPEWQAYRNRVKSYKTLLRKTKRKEWRSFCQNTATAPESARMNKILKSCSNNNEKLESVYKPDNTLTQTAEETLDVLVDTHFKRGPTNEQIIPTDTVTPTLDLLNKIYDPSRITKAVKTFEPDKAAGPDNIKPIILQKAWDHISVITRKIMMYSHQTQRIPDPWKESKGIFLAKPGKTDYYQAKSFRTITLTPVLLKLQERVILWHMQHDLKMTEHTSKRQFGFQKGCSTETALHKMIHKIERRIAKKGYVLGTFLDIEGAFDNVSFKAISEAITASPVDKSTSGWIINMVTNRHITIKHKDTTRRIQARRGCPQGGILSPFLWNLIVDDLLGFSANEIPGYLQAFADDLSILSEGNDLDLIRARTQKTIKTIENWCKAKGLNISALKTKVVLFTWKRDWTLRPIKVGGTTIELSDSVKFLGVTLDSKLNFNDHIDKITTKATAALMQCKRAVGPTWGLTPKTCKWIYTMVVRPILSYCAAIWVRALTTDKNIKKLARVQALALRIMSGALPGTPSESLDNITDIPGIVTFLKGEAAKGAARLQSYCDWTGETAPSGKGFINAHTTINNNYIEKLDLPRAERDLTKPILVLEREYLLDYPKGDIEYYKSSLPTAIEQIPSSTITCYTDGSRTDSGTGFGYIITTKNNTEIITQTSARMPEYSSVYQAELAAITAAAEELKDYTDRVITFLSDSLSSLQSLNNKTMNSKSVIHCHSALNSLGIHNTVKVMWIEAHVGHWGNEKADILAKDGTLGGSLVKGYLPQSYIKHAINTNTKRVSEVNWSDTTHQHTKRTLSKNAKTIKQDLGKLVNSRNNYRAAVQLITGHAALNYHLHKMTLVDTKICPHCEYADETVGHFLGQCPAFAQLRGEIFNTYYASLQDIFDDNSILEIVKYAAKTKRFLLQEEKDQGGIT